MWIVGLTIRRGESIGLKDTKHGYSKSQKGMWGDLEKRAGKEVLERFSDIGGWPGMEKHDLEITPKPKDVENAVVENEKVTAEPED